MSKWYLEDVVVAAHARPDTFFIPLDDERSGCAVGVLARLHFVLLAPPADGPRAERMWVEVAERRLNGEGVSYAGFLTNQPVFISDLTLGDPIEFLPIHIAQIFIPKSHPDWLDIGEKHAIVSAQILEPSRKARYAYREAPCSEEDSGWRLFSGCETQDFVDNSANLRLCNVGWLANRDLSLLQVFRAPTGSAFERQNECGDWAPASQ